jgi:hypothetical protein
VVEIGVAVAVTAAAETEIDAVAAVTDQDTKLQCVEK